MNVAKLSTLIPIVISVILFVLTPFWTSMFSEEKKLEYWTLSKSHLHGGSFGDSARAWPEIKTTYQGKELNDSTFLKVAIFNSGSLPIRPDDFESSIRVVTSSPGVVLQSRLLKSEPKSLNPKISIVESGVEIAPLLLNPNDILEFELFGLHDFEIDRIDSRIAGLHGIDEYKRDVHSGISVQEVKAVDNWHTIQRPLINISTPILAIVTFIILAMASFCFCRATATNLAEKLITYMSCLILCFVGSAGAHILMHVLSPENSPEWSKKVGYFTVTLIPILSGIYAHMFFNRKRLRLN